jgi:hypothetical protein
MTLFEIVREQRRNSLQQIALIEHAAAAEVHAGDVVGLAIIMQCVAERKRLRAAQVVDDQTEEIALTPLLSEVEN